jgi:hypothetical protein
LARERTPGRRRAPHPCHRRPGRLTAAA